MARVIKKNASKNGEVVIKEPNKFVKFIKSITRQQMIIAWDVVSSLLLITFIVLLAVRFWPSSNEVRDRNSIELKVEEYMSTLSTADEPIVEQILAEDLEDLDIKNIDQCYIYAYNPDVENCRAYWEYDETNSDWEYDDDENKISTGLYEQNSTIVIDLIDKLVSQTDTMWRTKLYIIDLTRSSNLRSITNVGGDSGVDVEIDLTSEGLSQSLSIVNFRNSSYETIGTSNLKRSIEKVQGYLYQYTYIVHTDLTNLDLIDTYELSYGGYLPISSSYADQEVKEKYYDTNNNDRPLYTWYDGSDLSTASKYDPNLNTTNKISYRINEDGSIRTEYHIYGERN